MDDLSDWPETERRQSVDVGQALYSLREAVREIRTAQKLMRTDLSCVRKQMEQYIPLLERVKRAEDDGMELKRKIIGTVTVSAIISAMGAAVIGLWDYLMRHPL